MLRRRLSRKTREGGRPGTQADGHRVEIRGPLGATVTTKRGHGLAIPVSVVTEVVGWSPKDGGWCLDGVCHPISGVAVTEGLVDLKALARALNFPIASLEEDQTTFVEVGASVGSVSVGRTMSVAPVIQLQDLDGSPAFIRNGDGRRRILVWVASWCGCRDDLSVWQRHARRLRDVKPGADIIAIALDSDPSAIAPFSDGLDLRVLIDPEHRTAEAFGILNVPTVVWIDEEDQLVRGPEQVFADNRLTEHHGLDSDAYHDAAAVWAAGGANASTWDERWQPTERQTEARVWARLGRHLAQRGVGAAADTAFDRAATLAPEDLTVRRSALLSRGIDPFGPQFVELYEEWTERTGGIAYRMTTPANQVVEPSDDGRDVTK